MISRLRWIAESGGPLPAKRSFVLRADLTIGPSTNIRNGLLLASRAVFLPCFGNMVPHELPVPLKNK